MGILDRYIIRQILLVTALGVVSLTVLMLLGNLFKQLRPLLIDSGAPPSIVMEFVMQVIPFSLIFAIPWGFLTATLLVYGRLSADNEITSMRMAGRGIWRIGMPALVLGVLFSAFSYYINIEVAPRSKDRIADIVWRAASINPKGLLREGQSITKFNNQEIFIDKREGDTLYGMHIYQNTPPAVLHAEEVDVDYNPDTRILDFILHGVFIDMQANDGSRQCARIQEMPWHIAMEPVRTKRVRANAHTNAEIREALDTPGKLSESEALEFSTELPRRISFSVACIVFALLAVPLAINTNRRDTSTGFVLGIAIAALYFVVLVFADLSRKSTGMLPHILLWAPNILTLGLAIILHRRVRLQG